MRPLKITVSNFPIILLSSIGKHIYENEHEREKVHYEATDKTDLFKFAQVVTGIN